MGEEPTLQPAATVTTHQLSCNLQLSFLSSVNYLYPSNPMLRYFPNMPLSNPAGTIKSLFSRAAKRVLILSLKMLVAHVSAQARVFCSEHPADSASRGSC